MITLIGHETFHQLTHSGIHFPVLADDVPDERPDLELPGPVVAPGHEVVRVEHRGVGEVGLNVLDGGGEETHKFTRVRRTVLAPAKAS